jgi:ATP-dependent helicase IRC3
MAVRTSLPRPIFRLSRYASTTSISPIILRPYQESCLDACAAALEAGASRIGVSLPTGSGKTTVFISLLSRILPPVKSPRAKRSLIIVNSIELARQSAAQAEALFPEWDVEIEQGVKHKATGLADVYAKLLFTMVSSLILWCGCFHKAPLQRTKPSYRLTALRNLIQKVSKP